MITILRRLIVIVLGLHEIVYMRLLQLGIELTTGIDYAFTISIVVIIVVIINIVIIFISHIVIHTIIAIVTTH